MPALPILTFPGLAPALLGVEESSLAEKPERFWTAVAECRPRDVEYMAVVDQNCSSLASLIPLGALSATSSTTACKHEEKNRGRRRDTNMGKFLGRIFVCFTIVLISFNGYSSQLFIIWPWYGREVSVDLLKVLVPFKFVRSTLLAIRDSV